MNIGALTDDLRDLARQLPAQVRKRVYKTAKIVASLATLVLLVLPALPELGVEWSGAKIVGAVLSVVIAVLGHLADSNTPRPAP